MNEKILRLTVFIAAAALHLVVLFFIAFDMQKSAQINDEDARIMKLTDLDELPPPPPPEPEIPRVEEIAEEMIETDTPPVQEVVAAGTIIPQDDAEVYLQIHQVSVRPNFEYVIDEINRDIIYPPIALRSGIEGEVFLELFIDRKGIIQMVSILREVPEDRGFGEAAKRAFLGRTVIPAVANGEPVSCRFRWPVRFKIN